MAIKYPNVGDTSQDNDVVLTTSAGRVGIGTTSPAAITHIHKPVTGAGSRTAPSGGLILSRYVNGSDYRASSIFHSYRENGGGDFEYMAFAVAGYQSGSPYDSSRVKMVLDESGNVGIGLTDPDRKLEIMDGGGNAQLKLSFDGTDNAQLQVDTNGDLTITPSGTKVTIAGNLYSTGSIIGASGSDLGSSSNRYANLYMSSTLNYSGDLAFSASGTEKMRLTTGGILGIGTTLPESGYKLHVVGKVRFDGNIKTNGYYISADGGDWGILVDSAGRVGINTGTPYTGGYLTVNGLTRISSSGYNCDIGENNITFSGTGAINATAIYLQAGGVTHLTIGSSGIQFASGKNIGFFGTTPVAKQTGTWTSLANVVTALQNLGLLA